MRFRTATESDIAAIAATFDGRNALPLEPRVRAALPGLLRQLVASPACMLSVFEERDWSGARVASFAGAVFLRDEVIAAYLAAPIPGLLSSVLADLLDDRRPLLTLDEIRRGNSGDGLTLAVFPVAYGQLEWDDPGVTHLRKLAPQAAMRDLGGYRLKAIYYEVFTDPAAEYLEAGGYRLLHDFSASAGMGFLPPHCRPRMLRLTPAECPPRAMNVGTQLFDPPRPELGLTPAEQRVALQALDGASDQTVAAVLGISAETVRATWRSIYVRLGHLLPRTGASAKRGAGTPRGVERRRLAIEYLRQNLHELRPFANGARRPLGPGGARR